MLRLLLICSAIAVVATGLRCYRCKTGTCDGEFKKEEHVEQRCDFETDVCRTIYQDGTYNRECGVCTELADSTTGYRCQTCRSDLCNMYSLNGSSTFMPPTITAVTVGLMLAKMMI